MNKQLLLIILLLFQSLSVFIPSTVSADWVIDGNMVYVDNAQVYLSVTPHTIIESDTVTFHLRSKQYSGNIDAIWLFNTTNCRPKKPIYLKIDDSDWNLLTKDIVVEDISYQGYNKAFMLESININQDVDYYLQVPMEVKFNSSGKYWFGIRKTGDPINQGLWLDPWWNSSWTSYRTITIDHTYIDAPLTNFPLMVYIPDTIASSCNGGNSTRFISTDNVTAFAYEIEYWNTTGGYVWVNISETIPSGTDYSFLMYYGNSNASDNQNPTGVWDSDYLAVHHMGDLLDSTSNDNDMTADGNPSITTGNVGSAYAFDGNDYLYTATLLDTCPTELTYEVWEYCTTDTTTEQAVMGKYQESGNRVPLWIKNDGYRSETRAAGTGEQASGGQSVFENGWYFGALRVQGGSQFNVTANTSTGTDKAIAGDYVTNTSSYPFCYAVYSLTENTYYFTGNIDEGRVSKTLRNDTWLNASFHSQNQTSGFLTWGGEIASLDAPTGFTAATISNSEIFLNWTKQPGATHIYLARKTGGYPTSRTDGTNIYNDTGVNYTDTGLSTMTVYYYNAWSFNSATGNWSGSTSATNHTGATNPTSIDGTVGTGYFNITWTKGTRADNTTVVRKATGYPTSHTDGTEIYNSSGIFYNDTSFSGGSYKLFSWNTTVNLFSSGVNAPYGSLTIDVYDENTSDAITGWDVFITNEAGTETYENTGNSNPLLINIDDLPTGANTAIKINATDYDFRLYYMDIYTNNHYTLDAYLSPENISELYLLYVLDEVDHSISDAKINIKQYINESEGYKNVSIHLTDANGQIAVYLIPGSYNSLYKIIISKTGYETETVDLIPRDIVYAGDWEYTFRLKLEEEEYENETTYNEAVTFEGYVDSTGYVHVNYTDSLNETTSTNICIYEHNTTTGNATVFYWDNRTNENDFTFNVLGNVSNCYEVVLSLVHTTFGTVTDSFIICGDERPYINISDQTWADALFEANYGTNPFGWSNLFGFFILIAGVFSFGQRNTGVALIVTGGILIFINTVIGWTVGGAVIPILFIILGVLVQWANHRREATG